MFEKKQPTRFNITVGDYVKFKSNKNERKEFSIYHGKVTEISSNKNMTNIGVQIDENDTRLDFPIGLTFYIERKQVIQNYSCKIVEHITPRLALKYIWHDFVFREVKTTKCSNLLYAEYRYIGNTGFEKIKRFKTIEDAYSNVSPEFHKNIVPCYGDFYGFTTDKALKSNDIYYDREIFFSKKCYCELDWSENPTGDFLINEIGYNNEYPLADSVICGIVENGEKGLFYRKWFLCSREFITLWTMICDPTDSSLYESAEQKNFDWSRVEKKKKIKELDKLLLELDTSFYGINLKIDINERRSKYAIHNLERAALYYTNRYKQVAQLIFSKYSTFTKETKFQRRLLRNILWAKRVS